MDIIRLIIIILSHGLLLKFGVICQKGMWGIILELCLVQSRVEFLVQNWFQLFYLVACLTLLQHEGPQNIALHVENLNIEGDN